MTNLDIQLIIIRVGQIRNLIAYDLREEVLGREDVAETIY
jgi:hypothetical protein